MRFSPQIPDFTKKQTQFKPNLTQNKPKTNPIQTQLPNTNERKMLCRKVQFQNITGPSIQNSALNFSYFFKQTVSLNYLGLSGTNAIKCLYKRIYRARSLAGTSLIKTLSSFSRIKLLSIRANVAWGCENQDRRKHLELFCKNENN